MVRGLYNALRRRQMIVMAFRITCQSSVCSTVCSDWQHRNTNQHRQRNNVIDLFSRLRSYRLRFGANYEGSPTSFTCRGLPKCVLILLQISICCVLREGTTHQLHLNQEGSFVSPWCLPIFYDVEHVEDICSHLRKSDTTKICIYSCHVLWTFGQINYTIRLSLRRNIIMRRKSPDYIWMK